MYAYITYVILMCRLIIIYMLPSNDLSLYIYGHSFSHRVATYSVLCVGAVGLYSGARAFLHRVAMYSISCVGAVVLYGGGAAYDFPDMGTGAPSRTVWRRILSCGSARLSCVVAATPMILMIWAIVYSVCKR